MSRTLLACATVMMLVLGACAQEDEEEKVIPCRDNTVCAKRSNGAYNCHEITIPDDCTELTLASHSVGDDGAKQIADALLGSHSHMKKLYLLYAKVGEEGAIAIANALRVNTALKSLWMDGNDIGEKGGIAIGEALAENKVLEVLGLSSCGIGNGARAIGKSMTVNHNLIQIAIGGNNIKPKAEHAIVESVNANKDARNRKEHREWVEKMQEKERLERAEEL